MYMESERFVWCYIDVARESRCRQGRCLYEDGAFLS